MTSFAFCIHLRKGATLSYLFVTKMSYQLWVKLFELTMNPYDLLLYAKRIVDIYIACEIQELNKSSP
jgi:hypothetical protein